MLTQNSLTGHTISLPDDFNGLTEAHGTQRTEDSTPSGGVQLCVRGVLS
jgi:hypothetical protein